MENRLYELQEKAEEDGLDALFEDFDPTKKKKKFADFAGLDFNPHQQLTSKLDSFLDKNKPGVRWDDEEK